MDHFSVCCHYAWMQIHHLRMDTSVIYFGQIPQPCSVTLKGGSVPLSSPSVEESEILVRREGPIAHRKSTCLQDPLHTHSIPEAGRPLCPF
jgi:hypothetical protein